MATRCSSVLPFEGTVDGGAARAVPARAGLLIAEVVVAVGGEDERLALQAAGKKPRRGALWIEGHEEQRSGPMNLFPWSLPFSFLMDSSRGGRRTLLTYPPKPILSTCDVARSPRPCLSGRSLQWHEVDRSNPGPTRTT